MEPRSHLRRDILGGLLGQQMGLITREQLLEAANTWIDDPSRSIAALLRDLGSLAEEDAETLDEVIQSHLSPTGSDAAAGAIPIDNDVREDLLALRPPADIRQWLAGLPARRGSAPKAPARGGRYELGLEIARGGLGRVVEARDRDLDREVAIKMLHEDLSADAAERFAREARITARLDHPNVVPIHDYGTIPGTDGNARLFLCMKRVRGTDLAMILESLAEGNAAMTSRWSRARLLRVFQDACIGVAYAHSKGVLHRDLKPSNIMVGDFGETYVVDWGLAKDLHAAEDAARGSTQDQAPASATITFDGDVVGTPAFMCPEQAGGRLHEVDERADVFALGAILYAILTLRPPYDGDTASEVLVNVRAGRISQPSTQVAVARERAAGIDPPGRRSQEPVPPELDALCMKALAFRKEDRFASALELHTEIQLFLDGVKELERRRRESRERLQEGLTAMGRYRTLGRDLINAEAMVKAKLDEVESWMPVEQKRPLWNLEARILALENDRAEAYTQALSSFALAIQVDPACREANENTCELLMDRVFEAERGRDRKALLLARKSLEVQDTHRKWIARVDAPGNLTLRAWQYSCSCLQPRRDAGWSAAFEDGITVPWEEGVPRADIPLNDRHRAVPALRQSPPEAHFGHTSACRRKEVRGVPVVIARYEIVEKRLQLVEERSLGVTPIKGATLAQGSWRCLLRPPGGRETRVPILIERGGLASHDVVLYGPEEVPAEFEIVPGGPFRYGGEYAGGSEEQVRRTADIFISRFPVTCAEYLEFLADLPLEKARARAPREGEKRFWIEDNGRFRLPRDGEDPKFQWDPRWPVFSMSWFDALAYCAWRSAKDGRVYRLPHEEELEKATRGVDGRIWSFGDEYDGGFAHTNASLQGRITPLPIGSFPVDESPYGIRDITGGVASLALNSSPQPYRDWRVMRGGAWSTNALTGKAGLRVGNPPSRTSWSVGFRLAFSPAEWPHV